MPRSIPTIIRNEILESRNTGEGWIVFITVSHSDIEESIRAANDVVNYTYQSQVFFGYPFKFKLLSDDERPTKSTISIQNVDQRIGQAIRSLATPPMLKIEILATTDFNETVDVPTNTRLPIGTPVPWYVADNLYLRNVTGDVGQISAEIGPIDLSVEPWPAIRCTKTNTPALFR